MNTEEETPIRLERTWYRGDGARVYLGSRYLGAYPTGALTYVLLLVAVFGFAWEVVESSLIGAALGAGLQEDLGMDATQLSWLLSAVTIASIVAFPFAGPLVDRLGRRPVILLGLAGFIVTDLIKALAPNYGVFLVANIIDGILVMLTLNPTMALVRDYTPREKRGLGYGIITSLGFGGGTLATFWLAAPVIAAHSDDSFFGMSGAWRWLYFYAFAVIAIAFLLQLFIIRDIHPSLRVHRRALTEDEDDNKVAARTQTAENGSVLAGIRQYLRSPRMLLIYLNQAFWGIGWSGLVSFLPLIMVVAIPNVDGATAAFLAGFVWIAYTASSIVTSVLQDRYHVRKPVNMLAMIGVAICLFIFASRLFADNSVVGIAVLLFFLGVFAGAQYPAFATVLAGEAERINPAAVASAFALYQFITALVGLIPRFVFPQIGAEPDGWFVAVIIMAIAVVFAAPTLIAAHGPWKPRRHLPENMKEDFI